MNDRVNAEHAEASQQVLEGVRQQLRLAREGMHARVLQGGKATDAVAGFTEFIDALLIEQYHRVMWMKGEGVVKTAFQDLCLVALGGYGRHELAPYSDLDLMVVDRTGQGEDIASLVAPLWHVLWDLGFQVGHSVRSFQDCVEVGKTDVSSRTAMMEARFLTGSTDVFRRFQRRYAHAVTHRRPSRYLEEKIEQRRREYEKYGETVYLLEPNVKKSKGGLRDLHLLQWAGMARHHALSMRELADRGVLSRADYRALLEAREFLWRIRILLHAQAGRAQEVLTFDEQKRLAAVFGSSDQPSLLGVEQFMQYYFRVTTGLHERSRRFVERCRAHPLRQRIAGWFPGKRIEEVFVVQGEHIRIRPDVQITVLHDPVRVVRLFELAQAQHLTIDFQTLEALHRNLEGKPADDFHTPDIIRAFRRILAGPSVGQTLEAMHRVHLLEKLIPPFARVRGLMQFNQYHKYTVDEHSLLAVANAEKLAADNSLPGSIYREIQRKDLLHLALLLHDLGKGCEEDHSHVGVRIAQETAARFALEPQEARTVAFLVERHLLMAHTAFRRDPYDEKVLFTFVRTVGTPELLRKLLVLTVADIAAVGPGVFTKWKESLLIQLYLRALPYVTADGETHGHETELKRLAAQVGDAVRLLPSPSGRTWSDEWIESQLTRLPERYLFSTSPPRIARHLAAIERLITGNERVIVESACHRGMGTCEYTVVTYDSLVPGIFAKLAGGLAGKGLQILDGQIVTREDGIVLDTFQVRDLDYEGEPPDQRLADVAQTLQRVLEGVESVDRLVARSGRISTRGRSPLGRQPSEVQIDNETSDRFTIIDVFAEDQPGLLFVMTQAIFEQDCSIHAARISTREDQAADVFCITDRSGAKILDPERIERLRSAILGAVDQFLDETDGSEAMGAGRVQAGGEPSRP